MGLFRLGSFQLHSGKSSRFKIDCDDLTTDDWDTLAAMVAHSVWFGRVVGVPQGGLPFAKALQQYADPAHERVLVVDDVLTTGQSMEEMRSTLGTTNVRGVVVFARGGCPSWVQPIFTYRLDREF